MNHHIKIIEAVLAYIEAHLDEKLSLEQIAQVTHYSKYHLHRMFSEMLGMTVGEYVKRRQLTEAAKDLVFSERSVLEIALSCGYDSQQAFTAAFSAFYKLPPAMYRSKKNFYPLQLPFQVDAYHPRTNFSVENIRLATIDDVPAWMVLMRLVVDGYPGLDEATYLLELVACIRAGRALVLYEGETLVAAMAFSATPAMIAFFGVQPAWRRRAGVERLFLQALAEVYLPNQTISMTTYRSGDKADTGQRAMLMALGFKERELLIEYGYPTQRMEWLPVSEKVCADE